MRPALAIIAVAGVARAATFTPVLSDCPAIDMRLRAEKSLVLLYPDRTLRIRGFEPAAALERVVSLAPDSAADGCNWKPLSVALDGKQGTFCAEANGRRARVVHHDETGKRLATSAAVECPAAAAGCSVLLECGSDGRPMLAFGPTLTRFEPDLARSIRFFEPGAEDADLFDPAGLVLVAGGGALVLDRFSARVWVLDSTGQLLWRFGGRGTKQEQFGEPRTMHALVAGEEPVLAIAHVDGGKSSLTLVDRYGNVLSRIDGVHADLVRASVDGELLILDRASQTVSVAEGLADTGRKIAANIAALYLRLLAAARARDGRALDALLPQWQNADDVPPAMRAAAFRIFAHAGLTLAADREIDRAITELPGRQDLLAEAMLHAGSTGRPNRAREILERSSWCIEDPVERESLEVLLVTIREQALKSVH